MADVFQRRSGRGWRLRQHSLQLLTEWQETLKEERRSAPLNRGLLLLASCKEDLERLRRLAALNQPKGAQVELISAGALRELVQQQRLPPLPGQPSGGLWSGRDGQLDPITWMEELQNSALVKGLQRHHTEVQSLHQAIEGWTLKLSNGEELLCNWVVLCAGLQSQGLLKGLGLDWPMEPVSGQALELKLTTKQINWQSSLVWRGINLVPRPDGKLWLGATVEPGTAAASDALEKLRMLQGDAPIWLQEAEVIQSWQGQRARPLGRPAPLLEQPLPGLLLVSGHYRNGILLGPASAAWAAEQITAVKSADAIS